MSESSVCYLNGEFLPLAEAKVPVLDRGFIFGDGIYEVIPVFNGHGFRLDEHLERLNNSLLATHIENPHSMADWTKLINELIIKNNAGHQAIYLQITRGVAQRDHAFPEDAEPTVFLMSNPLPETQNTPAVSAITLPDPRWHNCDIKAISLLPNVLLRQQAREQGANEAILIRDGSVTEGAASNVFVVKDGLIKTTPKGSKILPGVTRSLLLELFETHAVSYAELEITEAELHAADEIWLTSSTKEVVPVTQLDGKPVGNGEVGDMWKKSTQLYQAFKDTFSGSEAG